VVGTSHVTGLHQNNIGLQRQIKKKYLTEKKQHTTVKYFADISVPIYTNPTPKNLSVVKPAQNISHNKRTSQQQQRYSCDQICGLLGTILTTVDCQIWNA